MKQMVVGKLDVLPAGGEIEAEITDGRVRFRAYRHDELNVVERRSEWSGWFSLDDAPIYLTWAAFGLEDEG